MSLRMVAAVTLLLVGCVSPQAQPNATASFTIGSPIPTPATTSPATATSAAQTARPAGSPGPITLREFPVPAGSGPHDVAPAADGGVWYTAQRSGELGWLDPRTGQTKHVKLGPGSSPHGVIVGPDGAPWVTDSGLNAIVRVDPRTSEVQRFPLPGAPANLNTAVAARNGVVYYTGQNGYFGRYVPGMTLAPGGFVQQFPAPRGRGPYGITVTPSGTVFYASLAGHHIARVVEPVSTADPGPLEAEAIEPPTKNAGPRRVWSDSKGVIWVSEWDAGQLGRYDPASRQWKEWKLPGARPQAYAVFVDDRDIVWLSDFGASAIVRFDPATERFDSFPHAANGNVRQIHGRPGEVWGALSAHDKLLLVKTR